MEGNCDKAPQKCLFTCDFLTSLKLCMLEMEPLAQLTMQFIIPDFVFFFFYSFMEVIQLLAFLRGKNTYTLYVIYTRCKIYIYMCVKHISNIKYV